MGGWCVCRYMNSLLCTTLSRNTCIRECENSDVGNEGLIVWKTTRTSQGPFQEVEANDFSPSAAKRRQLVRMLCADAESNQAIEPGAVDFRGVGVQCGHWKSIEDNGRLL